jgi:hypothetical protein
MQHQYVVIYNNNNNIITMRLGGQTMKKLKIPLYLLKNMDMMGFLW